MLSAPSKNRHIEFTARHESELVAQRGKTAVFHVVDGVGKG